MVSQYFVPITFVCFGIFFLLLYFIIKGRKDRKSITLTDGIFVFIGGATLGGSIKLMAAVLEGKFNQTEHIDIAVIFLGGGVLSWVMITDFMKRLE